MAGSATLRSLQVAVLVLISGALVLAGPASVARAQTITWNPAVAGLGSPAGSDLNDPLNWSGETPPANNTLVFPDPTSGARLWGDTLTVRSMNFESAPNIINIFGAKELPATFQPPGVGATDPNPAVLTLEQGITGTTLGAGTTFNILEADSGSTPAATLNILNGTAGNATYVIQNSGTGQGLQFFNGSDAGHATIMTNAGTGTVQFNNNSTAENATITNGSDHIGGFLFFNDNSNAGSANITDTFGLLQFNGTASAASSTIMINGYFTFFNGFSTAGNATITNNSPFFFGIPLEFLNNSNAGTSRITNNAGDQALFADFASAAQATITNAGTLMFAGESDAGKVDPLTGRTSTIINEATGTVAFSAMANGDQANIANAGTLEFTETSKAGTSTITNTGTTTFTDTATADQANITNDAILTFEGGSSGGGTFVNATNFTNGATITTNNGGVTEFDASSNGDMARFITNPGGVVDISHLTTNGMTSGSIAGAGNYNLGSKTLTTDLNNDSTEVSGVISGAGGSLVKMGTGVLTLSGHSTYTGQTAVNEGVINLTGSLLSPVNVASAGTLGSTGIVSNTVTNAGTVEPGFALPTGTFGRLTVNNYVGAGGTLALRTFLGADGSPSDVLAINGGGATGSTSIHVTNAGGAGAITTGNGILVVNATNGATTDPTAFTLGNSELRGGPYDYRLFRGDVGDPDPPNDWFLRSSLISPPEEEEAEAEEGATPPPADPIIGPEDATYSVVQPLARQLALTQLGTLHQRIGDTLTTAYPEGNGVATSAWGRFFGGTIDNRYQGFAVGSQGFSSPSANGHQFGFQAGLDIYRGSLIPDLPDHRDVAGVYFSYANSNTDVTGPVTNEADTAYVLQRTGTVDLNAYSGGAYWTHYGPTGWYLDGVLQFTGYSGDAKTQFADLSTGGFGFLMSLEGGYPIPLQFGPNFILEPQAQVIWQHVSFDQANDGLGAVSLGSSSGTTGRLGARGQWSIAGANGAIWQPYARFNLWHGWDAGAQTNFAPSSVPVTLNDEATWLEFAGGLTYKLNTKLSLYTQAGYQVAVAPGNVNRNGFTGNIGLRYTW